MDFSIKSLDEKFSVKEIVNIHFFEFQNGFTTLQDKHPFSELVFVSNGSIFVSSDEWSGTLKKGEMIIHPENSMHSLSCDKNSNPTVIVIGFKCKESSLLYFSNHIVKLTANDIKLLSNIIKESRYVFKPPYDKPTLNMKKKKNQLYGAEHLLKISIEQFLIMIIREYSYKEITDLGDKISFSTSEIISYVEQNFLEKMTIDELAFLFQTNRSDLCASFKNATGKTINQYVLDKKAKYAFSLITSTDKSFNDISEELHFDSQSYFTRFIISKFQKSPKQLREEYLK